MNILKLLVVIIIFGTFAGCSNNNKPMKENDLVVVDSTAVPKIHFFKKNHDFGLIQQGEKVSYVFKLQNIGNANLIITDAKPSCGCTVPKFSSEPILPGEEGKIEVVFDSFNRVGRQTKSVTVFTNSEEAKVQLSITSDVVVPTIN